MFRPDPMPTGAVGNQADEVDTSCLNCFSRRVGLISLAWIIVVMNCIGIFGTIQLMTLGVTGGTIAILVIYMLIQLVDIVLACLVLLGVRDGVVRTRLNIWLIWNIGYCAVLLVLFIIFVSAVSGVVVGEGVLSGIRLALIIALRIYCCYSGWKYREDLMSAPPPATQRRPEGGPGPQPTF